jgi:RNA polymerase sigma factor (sigma-70 family)
MKTERTIKDAAIEALILSGKPSTSKEIYDVISNGNLYEFKGKNPVSILKIEIMRQCEGICVTRSRQEKFFTIDDNGRFWLKNAPVVSESVIEPKGKFSEGDLEDIRVLDRMKEGNLDAFAIIFNKYKNSITRKIMQRMNYDTQLAEDLTMDIFAKVYVKCLEYEKNYTFNSWLTRICDNYVIDYVRKKKVDTVSMDTIVGDGEDGEYQERYVKSDCKDPYQLKVKKERMEFTRKAVDELDEVTRTVVELRFFQEMSYEEISQELNMPMSTVKIRLHRAKDKLKEILEPVI